MKTNNFECELCQKCIKCNEPHIRIGVDSVILNKDNSYTSTMDNDVVIFALFHHKCVLNTIDSREHDNIYFIDEARQMVSMLKSENQINHSTNILMN